MNQDFFVGTATAAYQVEGNNVHSDFWVQEHVKHTDFTEKSGAACDHYNRYEEDIRLLAEAGCNAYRFSIEWGRIEPKEGRFDESEVEHYRKVIDCCYENGVTPIATLMHFSSPAWLISKGGWGKESVVKAFERYARFIAERLGKKLPYICTINEANMGGQLNKVIADMRKAGKRKEGSVQVGQNTGLDMKVILLGMFEQGRAFHTSPFAVNTFLKPRKPQQEEIVMRAHQAAKAAIKRVCPDTKVGLTLSLFDYQPVAGGEAQTEKLWQEDFGWYLPFIREDDFVGVQNYSRKLVDANGVREPAPDAPVTQMGYEDYPQSIGHVVEKVSHSFQGEILVTENGIATADDARRCEFIRQAFASVMEAMAKGAKVRAYCYWSLLDNFEWQAGYSKTFGVIAVDRRTQKRTPKESLAVLGGLNQMKEGN